MPVQKRRPLVSSVAALRALAAGITLLSLGGMAAYATDHFHDAAAPLHPAAATPAVPAVTTRTTTGRIQLSAGVGTTTAKPVTTTRRS